MWGKTQSTLTWNNFKTLSVKGTEKTSKGLHLETCFSYCHRCRCCLLASVMQNSLICIMHVNSMYFQTWSSISTATESAECIREIWRSAGTFHPRRCNWENTVPFISNVNPSLLLPKRTPQRAPWQPPRTDVWGALAVLGAYKAACTLDLTTDSFFDFSDLTLSMVLALLTTSDSYS